MNHVKANIALFVKNQVSELKKIMIVSRKNFENKLQNTVTKTSIALVYSNKGYDNKDLRIFVFTRSDYLR